MLLVTLFSLPLIAPAMTSTPDDSQLPACCRRGGKHECAMNMQMGAVPSRFHVVSEKCPYAPYGHAPFLLPHALATPIVLSGSGIHFGPAAVIGAAEAGYRISADRTRQKRGPPPALAL